MKTVKACIVDDDNQLIVPYVSTVQGCFRKYGVNTDVDSYNSTAALKARILNHVQYDVMFLDIDLSKNKEDGVTFAKWLRAQGYQTPIIFVTSRDDRMFDTFAVQPFGYVRKSRFMWDIDETIRLFTAANPELSADLIIFGNVQVNAKQIMYIECVLHSQWVHLKNQPAFEIHSSMEQIEKILGDKGFIRIHKGYLLNYRYIKHIDNMDVLLTDGTRLPLSRQKKKDVKKLWLELGMKNGFVYVDC